MNNVLITNFMSAPQTRLIMAFIFLDVLIGTIAALRQGVFDVKKFASFYRTNVMPYLVGYFGLWLFLFTGLGDVVPNVFLTMLSTIGASAALASLTKSIYENYERAKTETVVTDVTQMIEVPLQDQQG